MKPVGTQTTIDTLRAFSQFAHDVVSTIDPKDLVGGKDLLRAIVDRKISIPPGLWLDTKSYPTDPPSSEDRLLVTVFIPDKKPKLVPKDVQEMVSRCIYVYSVDADGMVRETHRLCVTCNSTNLFGLPAGCSVDWY